MLRTGFRSFRSALASICRILSRVTLNSLPTSSKVRLRKPNPEIYHLACRCIRSKEENCAYVGDNPVRDVEGTQAAGFGMMIRIDEPDTLNREKASGKEFTPDHVITALSQLLDIFPGRN